MEANGITAQYKITLKGLLKQKSNVGSALFSHIFIAFSLWGCECHGGAIGICIYSEEHPRAFTRESSVYLGSLLIFSKKNLYYSAMLTKSAIKDF